jgi:glycosyltransferase involved in cell wall biosynthesis
VRVVMLVKNSFEYDARVTKEARTLLDQGHEVHVVAIHVPDRTARHEVRADGIEVHRVSRVNLGVDALNRLAGRYAGTVEERRARLTGEPVDELTARELGNLGTDTTATPGDAASTRSGPAGAGAATPATTDGVTAVASTAGPGDRVRRAWGELSTEALRLVARLARSVFRIVKAVLGRQGQGLKHWAINRRFIATAAALDPDVVHCHDLNTLWAGRRVKEATGCLLVYDSHEMATARNRMTTGWRLWTEHFERVGVPDADEIIMASPGYAQVCRERYGRDSTVIINVPPRQEPTGTRDVRTATGLPDGPTLCIYQGSIQENRGIEQVIDAIELLNARVPDDDPGAALVVVGYGYHRTPLERLVRDRGLGDVVRFFGPVPNPELVDWSSSADIGMCNIVGTSPSYRESLPNKLFEYVMAGIPVIVSDFGSMGRICEEQGVGLTCDPTDPSALADAIAALRDPAVYERCRAATPAMADRYNWEVEQQALVELYERLATRVVSA